MIFTSFLTCCSYVHNICLFFFFCFLFKCHHLCQWYNGILLFAGGGQDCWWKGEFSVITVLSNSFQRSLAFLWLIWEYLYCAFRCSQFDDPLMKSCLESTDQDSKMELRRKRKNRDSEIQDSSDTPATRILRSMKNTAVMVLRRRSTRLISKVLWCFVLA